MNSQQIQQEYINIMSATLVGQIPTSNLIKAIGIGVPYTKEHPDNMNAKKALQQKM